MLLTKRTILSLCASVLALAQAAFGQFSIIGKEVTEVDININGPKTVSESRIRNYMSVKAGQVFSYDKLDEDVKNLYESGLVDDVKFLAEPTADGIKIVAEVETRPSLSKIEFEGNHSYSDSKLRMLSGMKPGGALNDGEILKGKRAIEKHYKNKGYPDMELSYRLEKSKDGYSDLHFVIKEGEKGQIDEIYFEGNDAFADVVLEKEMKTKEKGIFSFITKSGQLDGAVLEEDVQKVVKYYQNNGYLRANIPGIERKEKDNGKIDLILQVSEGERYTVSGVGFNGMKVFTYDQMWPALSLIKGDSYSADKMQADIKMIRNYYGAKGYADVRVRPELKNTANNGVAISYNITEGKRYKVGRVNIQGNENTKDHVVRREVPLTPGKWFNSVDLDITKSRLRNLNYFNNVSATGSKSSREGYRDVDIQVSEKRTGSLGFGAGFSSIDSIVGYINLEQTNFDIMDPWGFTGGGQRFSMSARAGSQTQDFRVGLTEPWFLGRRLSFGGELYYQDRRFLSDEFDQRNWGGALNLRKPLGKRGSIKAEYRMENVLVAVNAANLTNGSSFAAEDGEYWRSALSLSYLFDSRDSNITPRRGEKLDLTATYAGGVIGGDVDAYTLNARASKHFLLPFDVIINLTNDFTVVDSTGDGSIPIFERTFIGGARNLRGFDFRDVGSVARGTRDAVTNETIGGQTSAIATAELTFPIANTVRGAVFGDAGFVNVDEYDFDPAGLHTDVGVGVRLQLPFGPFAIDYAIPVEFGDQLDDSGRFQFYLDYKF